MSAEEFAKKLAEHMEPVARQLLGEPNKHFTKPGVELRWGEQGSMSVDLKKGTWFSHEDGEGGGTLALICKLTGRTDGEAVEWLREEGYDLPAGEPPVSSNRSAAPDKREIVQTWDYVDRDGNPVFQVARVQHRQQDGSWRLNKYGKIEKTFVQRRQFQGEDDVWINGLLSGEYMRKGPGKDWSRYSEANFTKWRMKEKREFADVGELPLYRLPEVLEAIAMGQAIHLVEGEKKADVLWAEGIAATCNAGGSKKWEPQYTDMLRGAHVVMVSDNDDVGRMHMQMVGGQLLGNVASLRDLDIRQFWPQVPAKGDVWDWKQTGADVSSIYDHVEVYAKPWKRVAPKSRFNAIPFGDLDLPGMEHEYLIDDTLTRHEVAIIYGESGSGKSFESIDIGMAVARGIKFHGMDVIKGGVIYQAGEGGVGVRKRLRAYRETFMQPDEHVDFILLPSRVDLFAPVDQQDIETSRGTDALIAEINAWAATFALPLELVVIDTLATATPGANENASTDMSVVLRNLERIRDECRCAVLMVHHKPKEGKTPRGHSSLFANVDNAIELEITQRQDVSQRSDGTALVRQIHRATVQKNKDGERGHGWDFILKQVVLGTRPNGKPLTSVVCAAPGGQEPQARDDRGLSDQQTVAMNALFNAIAKYGEPTPAVLKLPGAIKVVVRMGHWKNEFEALTLEDDDDPVKRKSKIRQALKRAGERFMALKYVGRAEPYVWLTGRTIPGYTEKKRVDMTPPPLDPSEMSAGLAETIDGDIQL